MVFKDLITSTKMGWDEENNTVVGSEENWRNAIAVNPHFRYTLSIYFG